MGPLRITERASVFGPAGFGEGRASRVVTIPSSNGTRSSWAVRDDDDANGLTPRWTQVIHDFREFVLDLASGRQDEPRISEAHAKSCLRVWWRLYCDTDGELEVPDVGPGPDGEVLFIWSRGPHYLSLELKPDERPEFFSRNRETGRIWGQAYDPDSGPMPSTIREQLTPFLDTDPT